MESPRPVMARAGNVAIPVSAREEARVMLSEKLDKYNWENIPAEHLQNRYEYLLENLSEVCRKYGKNKSEFKTDDKLSPETKLLISKRRLLRSKINLSYHNQIELMETKKLIKIKIREDIRKFNEEIISEILEDSWSTKKTQRALADGVNLLPKISSTPKEIWLRVGNKLWK